MKLYLREKKYAVSEKFIQSLVIKIWKHTIYTDGRHGMMTRSMQCNWIKTLFIFTIREKVWLGES